MISLLLLVNRQGKVRLIKWYLPFEQKNKKRFVKEVSTLSLVSYLQSRSALW